MWVRDVFNSMTIANSKKEKSHNIYEHGMGNSTKRESPADRVRIVCDLFNLAFEMKSLELERRFPLATLRRE